MQCERGVKKENIHKPEEAGEWRKEGRSIGRQVQLEEGMSLHISDFNLDRPFPNCWARHHLNLSLPLLFHLHSPWIFFQLWSSSEPTIMAGEQSDTNLHKCDKIQTQFNEMWNCTIAPASHSESIDTDTVSSLDVMKERILLPFFFFIW